MAVAILSTYDIWAKLCQEKAKYIILHCSTPSVDVSGASNSAAALKLSPAGNSDADADVLHAFWTWKHGYLQTSRTWNIKFTGFFWGVGGFGQNVFGPIICPNWESIRSGGGGFGCGRFVDEIDTGHWLEVFQTFCWFVTFCFRSTDCYKPYPFQSTNQQASGKFARGKNLFFLRKAQI